MKPGDASTTVVQGLSSADAAARLARYGENRLPRRPPIRLWRRVVAQLRDPLIVVLLVAAALTVATGDRTDMTVILLVIVVNTTVGVGQEIRADHAISALSDLTAPAALVLRDGEQREIQAAEVVMGDLLVLAEGDIVPADAAVVESAALLVDESSLTGESVPVAKTTPVEPAGLADADAVVPENASVSAGTVVVKGRGRAVVTATDARPPARGACSTTRCARRRSRVCAHRLPRREIRRQCPPGTGPHHIQDRVHHLAAGVLLRAPTLTWRPVVGLL